VAEKQEESDSETKNFHKRHPTGYYSTEATIHGRDWRVAMLKYLRIAVTALSLITLPIFGCADKSSTTPITPSKAKAINAAKEWFNSQGMDPKAAEFSVEPEGTGWSVLIQRQPLTPGAHTLLLIDSDGKVIKVIPGR
jgi:hypothetical protein